MRIPVLAVLAVLGGGCHWSLNDPGTEPPVSQLYFPSGIAMDPTGRFAYVANGNADLKYGGGSVQMIDVHRFECAASYARAQLHLPGATTPDATTCPDMAQMAADTAAPWCQQDPLDPTIVDCDEDPFIIKNATVKVGNFAGSVRLLERDQQTRRLFVAVRGDPSITYMDVSLKGIDLNVSAKLDLNGANKPAPGLLNCFSDVTGLMRRNTYDPRSGLDRSPPACDQPFLLQLLNCRHGGTSDNGKSAGAGFPFCPAGTDDVGDLQLPTEPFGMKLDQSLPGASDPYAYLLISHLGTGQVSLIDAVDNAPDVMGKPRLDSTSQQFFPPTSSGLRGAFMLAPQHPHQQGSSWYMTSNQTPIVATFHIANVNEIVSQGSFSVQSTFVNGADLRDIIFDTGGDRAFLTENNPPSVITLDTHTPSNLPTGGQPANVVTSVVDVCQTPSHMGILRQLVAGAPGTPPRVKTKLVVVCFLSSQVMIVDPDRPGVDTTIYSGLAGPNDVAFTFADAQDGSLFDPPPPWQHAWVTNYSESTISVVELAPGSANENRVIARLGFPQDGPQGRTSP
jgi:hypothetical protein